MSLTKGNQGDSPLGKCICENGKDMRMVPQEIEERKVISTGVGKSEIDVFIKAQKGYTIYIDIKCEPKGSDPVVKGLHWGSLWWSTVVYYFSGIG